MINLGLAFSDIGRSAHGVYHATDRQQKLQNTETLVLGLLRTAATASICLSLYKAYFVIKNPNFQYALAGFTFCAHPLATLDVIGTTCCINGLFHVIIAYIPQMKIAAEINKLFQKSVEQLHEEGFEFYNFWQRILWGKREPPATTRRLEKVLKEIAAKYDFTQIKAWSVPMAKDWSKGTTLMKYTLFSGIGALFANAVPASFWLDQKLVNLSKRLAQQLV